jgi:transcriptional regulator with XRE-family HTH domain
VATKEQVKLDVEHAEAIIELGIKYGAAEIEEVPDSKKDKIAAANEIIAFSIDAYTKDGMTPDDDDPEIAESGEQILEILELGGITIDDDGDVVFGELPDLDDDGEEDEESDDGEDEAPFDPDDYIEGYTELSVSSKVKAIKALDAEDEDDVATMEAIAEWENEQDKPSARVLNLIEETLGAEEEEESADAEGDATEEPWDGYDKSSAVEIKKVLTAQLEDEDEPLTAEQVEYVLEYERNREKPPPRKRIITFCEELLEQFANGDAEEAEEEDEKPKGGLAAARAKRAKGTAAASNGVITLTREQILEALSEGEVTIEV